MGALPKHAGPALVAVLYVALALAVEGSDQKATAIVTIVVWWLVVIGLIARLWPGSEAPRAAVACGGSLAALCALSGLSMIWADDAGRAFDETVRVAGYLGIFVLTALASRRGSAPAWAAGLALGLGAVASLALLARFEPGLLTEGAGDLGAEIPSAAGRLSYPVGYWNGLGAVMALALVTIGWAAARGASRNWRALAAAALPLPILAIYLSQSLGGALAAAVGVGVLLLAARWRVSLGAALLPGLAGGGVLVWLASLRDELRAATPGAELGEQGDEMLVLTLVVAAAVAALAYGLDPALERLRSVHLRIPRPAIAAAVVALAVAAFVVADPVERWEEFKDPGTLAAEPDAGPSQPELAAASAAGNGRYQWWSAALDGWSGDAVTGLGAANWELHWNAHADLPVFTRHAHSLYFETFAELGVIGLLSVLAFFGAAIAAGIGRRGSSRGQVAVWLAVVAAGAVSAAGEWTWQIPAAIAPVVVAAAVLTGPATLRPRWPRSVRADRDSAPGAERPGFGIGVATLLGGFACLWIGGVSLLATIQLDESRAAAERGDADEAARNASYAGSIEPWAADPRLELAGAEGLRGRLAEARAAAEQAVERAPGDFFTHVVLARILARQGERAEAEEELAIARDLSPQPLDIALPAPDG